VREPSFTVAPNQANTRNAARLMQSFSNRNMEMLA
jgi:hypothetical protein